MDKEKAGWPATFTEWPEGNMEAQKQWFTKPENTDFTFCQDDTNRKLVAKAIRKILDLTSEAWSTARTKACYEVLGKPKKSAQVTPAMMERIVAVLVDRLQFTWALGMETEAREWLAAAVPCIQKPLVEWYLDKDKPSADQGAPEGSTPTTPPGSSVITSPRPQPVNTATSTTTGPSKRVAGSGPADRPYLRPDDSSASTELRHKPAWKPPVELPRFLDRIILVSAEGRPGPLVVGMHVLVQDKCLELEYDNVTVQHLCWEKFHQLLCDWEPRYANYGDNGDELHLMWDPDGKPPQDIRGATVFRRAVEVLSAAGPGENSIPLRLEPA